MGSSSMAALSTSLLSRVNNRCSDGDCSCYRAGSSTQRPPRPWQMTLKTRVTRNMSYHTRQHKGWPTVTDPGHPFGGFGGLHPHPAAYLLRGSKAVTSATAGDGVESLFWLLDTISFNSLDSGTKEDASAQHVLHNSLAQ